MTSLLKELLHILPILIKFTSTLRYYYTFTRTHDALRVEVGPVEHKASDRVGLVVVHREVQRGVALRAGGSGARRRER